MKTAPKINTHSEMTNTVQKSAGPSRPTKHLPHQNVSPASNSGQKVRRPGSK